MPTARPSGSCSEVHFEGARVDSRLVTGRAEWCSTVRDIVSTAIVTPDTILRWCRQLIAERYDGSAQRGPGRPRVDAAIRTPVRRMATEKVRCGFTQRVGALENLGYAVGRRTVRRLLTDEGIDRAPERSERIPWKTFPKAHLREIAEADFVTVEVLTLVGLLT